MPDDTSALISQKDFEVLRAVVALDTGKVCYCRFGPQTNTTTKASATIDITAVIVMDPISSNCTRSQHAKRQKKCKKN